MKWFIVSLFLMGFVYIRFRGKAHLPFLREFFNHSTLMAPINVFMYLFSKVPTQKPYLPTHLFANLQTLETQWEIIREEAKGLIDQEKIRAADKNNDAGFNSFFKTGWKRFYLKWYDAKHPSAEKFCPKTVELLQQIPCIKAAMFAELAPHSTLNPHRDPYAGSLRYHLGLITPNDDRCFIVVDNEQYSWRDGQAVVFDETYLHHAHNNTDSRRIILFCDIERPMRYRWAQAINRWFGKVMMTAAASPNEIGDETGSISRLFHFVWIVGQYRRRLKKFNKPLYLLTKFSLISGAIVGIILL